MAAHCSCSGLPTSTLCSVGLRTMTGSPCQSRGGSPVKQRHRIGPPSAKTENRGHFFSLYKNLCTLPEKQAFPPTPRGPTGWLCCSITTAPFCFGSRESWRVTPMIVNNTPKPCLWLPKLDACPFLPMAQSQHADINHTWSYFCAALK